MSTEEKAENPESRVQGWVSRVKEGESPRSRVQSGLKRARGEIHWETHWNPLLIRGNEIQGYKIRLECMIVHHFLQEVFSGLLSGLEPGARGYTR